MFDRFKKKKSLDELEEEGERLTVEAENTNKQADIVERKAVISELKKRYGPSWSKTLGVSKWTDLSTLRSFLRTAKKGMEKHAGSTSETPVSKLYSYSGIKKA